MAGLFSAVRSWNILSTISLRTKAAFGNFFAASIIK